MKRFLPLALVLALVVSAAPAQRRNPNRGPFEFVGGTWKIVGYFETGGPAAIGEEELATLVGTRVQYSANTVIFGKRVLEHVTYTDQSYSEDRFLQEFNLYCRNLGICGAPITVVEASNPGNTESDFPGRSVVWIDHDHLAAFDQGVFLKLTRIGGPNPSDRIMEPISVGMLALLSAPQEYNGLVISTIGVFHHGPDKDSLFFRQEDVTIPVLKNSFALALTPTQKEQFKALNMNYVMVQGTMKSSGPAGPDLNSGTIANITVVRGLKPNIPPASSKK